MPRPRKRGKLQSKGGEPNYRRKIEGETQVARSPGPHHVVGGLRPPKWKSQAQDHIQPNIVRATSEHQKGSQQEEEVDDGIESLYATDEHADPMPDVPDSPDDSLFREGQESDSGEKLSK